MLVVATTLSAALVCGLLTLLPPILGFVAFLATAVAVRYWASPSFPKRWLLYGALGGTCLFFAGTLFMAERSHELPMAFYGHEPNRWTQIALHLSFPVGGFFGGLISYLTGLLVGGASPRSVRIGSGAGLVVATIVTAVYIGWLLHCVDGRVKYPSVAVVFCLVVWLLCLCVGGVLGTLLGAGLSRWRHRGVSSERPASDSVD